MALFDPMRFFLPEAHAWNDGKNVKLGANAARLPVDEIAALIAHEDGHIKLGHRKQRIRWLWTFQWLDFDNLRAMCWDQELAADLWAVRHGHGPALRRYLNRRTANKDLPGMWHPPALFRLAMIEQFERAKDGAR